MRAMNEQFQRFIDDRVLPQHRDIVRTFVLQMERIAQEATPRMRGGTDKYPPVPVYRVARDVVAISPTKTGITFSFSQGARFDDPFGLLGGAGKRSRVVRVSKIDEYPEEAFGHYIRQAVELDRQ